MAEHHAPTPGDSARNASPALQPDAPTGTEQNEPPPAGGVPTEQVEVVKLLNDE
ncbi:hypothetical protein [Actinosynnema sp. NPDC023587]|uniref:hypothetical protein n=1 Tax=Actinosynnema sp. NPDC023587 TaxID=3154695 RepID=UPI0033F63060